MDCRDRDRLANYMSDASFLTFLRYIRTRAASPIRYFIEQTVKNFFSWIPGVSGMFLRAIVYKLLLKKGSYIPFIESNCEFFYMSNFRCGKSVYIDSGCRIHASKASIELGNNVRVMRGAYLCTYVSNTREGEGIITGKSCWIGVNAILASGQGGIFLGDNVLIGPQAILVTGNHDFINIQIPIIEQEYVGRPIHIGSNVWIGANVVILGGVSIGEYSVIAAGSVVTKDVESYTVAGGVPTVTLRKIRR